VAQSDSWRKNQNPRLSRGFFVPTCRFLDYRSTPGDQVEEQSDHGKNQQNMDK
jgi:hypothetical protein